MKTYFTSDLHLFHKNICKFTNRHLVTSQEDHNNWVIDLWNNQIEKQDKVYILGDISFGKIDNTKEVLSKLNGQLFVVKGNHDRREDLDKLKECNLIQNWYEYKEIKAKDTNFILFHFPIASWHKQGYGAIHLYGHCHGTYTQEGKCVDVGLDSSFNIYGEYRLFSEDDIFNLMELKQVKVVDHHKIMEE